MRRIESIEVPAKAHIELKPGGLHMMLFDLSQDVKMGGKVPIQLTFAKAGTIRVAFPVKLRDGSMKSNDHSGHSGHTTSN